MATRDWVSWHEKYEEGDSWYAKRLHLVQQEICEMLDGGVGPCTAVSICAGQGRDLIEVLADHPRGSEVTARLVELDERNVEIANDAARAAGLSNVSAVAADAGVTDTYLGAVPADLVVLSGVFGNLRPKDMATMIRTLPALCAPGATVIWTYGHKPRRLWATVKRSVRQHSPRRRTYLPQIRRSFLHAGFEEIAFEEVARGEHHRGSVIVASCRLRGSPAPLVPGKRIFTFAGPGALK